MLRVAQRLFERLEVYVVPKKAEDLASYFGLGASELPAALVLHYDFTGDGGYRKTPLANLRKESSLFNEVLPFAKDKRRDRTFMLNPDEEEPVHLVTSPFRLQEHLELAGKSLIVDHGESNETLLAIKAAFKNDYYLVHARYQINDNQYELTVFDQARGKPRSLSREDWRVGLSQVPTLDPARFSMHLSKAVANRKGLLVAPQQQASLCSFFGSKHLKFYYDCLVVGQDQVQSLETQIRDRAQEQKELRLPVLFAFKKGQLHATDSDVKEKAMYFLMEYLKETDGEQGLRRTLVEAGVPRKPLVLHLRGQPTLFVFLSKAKKSEYGKHLQALTDLAARHYRLLDIFILDADCNQQMLKALGLDPAIGIPYLLMQDTYAYVAGNSIKSPAF